MPATTDPERVVLDTNVLVSAVLFGGGPLTLLELVRSGELRAATSEYILDEFKRVLTSRRFGLSPSLVEQLIDEMLLFTCQVTPATGTTRWTRDVQDDPVVETAIAARAAFLISGDHHLLEAKIREVKVVTVAEMLRLLGRG
jgi:putative PIN family toxin of toxin-antitoxin system